MSNNETAECCPKFEPAPWDDQVITWDRKLYFFYTTCPRCAQKYGKNYVVILAQV